MNPLFPEIDSIYHLVSNSNEKFGSNIFLSTKSSLDENEVLTYSELLVLINGESILIRLMLFNSVGSVALLNILYSLLYIYKVIFNFFYLYI